MTYANPPRKYWWVDPARMDDGNSDDPDRFVTDPLEEPGERMPTVVSSITDYGQHAPVLDIDFPIRCEPSSTPGHFHLYLDGIQMEWEQYRRVLEVLGEVGILGPGYVKHSIERGQTVVRLPWSRKPPKEPIDFTAITDEEPF